MTFQKIVQVVFAIIYINNNHLFNKNNNELYLFNQHEHLLSIHWSDSPSSKYHTTLFKVPYTLFKVPYTLLKTFSELYLFNQQEYLLSIHWSDDDPAAIFNWNINVVDAFALNVNAAALGIARPLWLTQGVVTSTNITQDIINYLALVGGGSFGSVSVSPNTQDQYTNVMTRLTHVESNPFFQVRVVLWYFEEGGVVL